MKIGIDFDNTIANYDNVFKFASIEKNLISKKWYGTKSSLKKKIIKENSIIEWHKLQGQVYGRLIHKAKLFSGLKRFLIRCSIEKHEIYILSHKTQFGHFDSMNINLRSAALNWMKNEKFFDKDFINLHPKKVLFFNTRESKIKKIKNLKLDFMVDDLPEVFDDQSSKKTINILFRTNPNKTSFIDYKFNTWWEIENFTLGATNDSNISKIGNFLLTNEKITGVKRINESGNSCVYQVETNMKNKYALKQYPSPFLDKKKRLKTEIMATQLLLKTELCSIPYKWDVDLNIAIFYWIEGISIKTIRENFFYQLYELTEVLWKMSRNLSLKIPYAAESCRKYEDICNQIDKRFNELMLIEHFELRNFLIEEFKPLLDSTKQFSFERWPANNIDKNLDRTLLTFSPSDFGFHNALQINENKIKFIDFEYFGLDDPVKLICDILWHPGMTMTKKQKKLCTKQLINIFQKDIFLIQRLNAAFPLYGLRWALIILNEFLPQKWLIRTHANKSKNSNKELILLKQLEKASLICKKVNIKGIELSYD